MGRSKSQLQPLLSNRNKSTLQQPTKDHCKLGKSLLETLKACDASQFLSCQLLFHLQFKVPEIPAILFPVSVRAVGLTQCTWCNRFSIKGFLTLPHYLVISIVQGLCFKVFPHLSAANTHFLSTCHSSISQIPFQRKFKVSKYRLSYFSSPQNWSNLAWLQGKL